MAVELMFRGYSHYSMFVLGGGCFLLIGQLGRLRPCLSLALRTLLGAAICTFGELLFGMLFNQGYTIWDYRDQPGNFAGQICPLFTLLWVPLSLLAIVIFDRCDRLLSRSFSSEPKEQLS